MNKYFTTFKDIDAYNSFVASAERPNINVSYISDSDEVKYFKEHVSLQPFTMEIVSLPEGIDNIQLSFVTYNYANDGYASHGKFKCSYDEGETWTKWYEYNGQVCNFNDEIVLHEGDKVSIIGGYGDIVNVMHFFQDRYIPEGGVKINVSGNVSSLLLGEDFYLRTLDEIDYEYGSDFWGNPFGPFSSLFNTTDYNDIVWVLDASDLWLPGSGLVPSCYARMFMGQQYLTTDIPNIYAYYLPAKACESMFENCSSLTTMPDIYATTFGKANALDYTFRNCSSLVTTTPLRVNHIESNEDWQRLFLSTFENCTSLTTTPQFSLSQIEDVKGTRFLIDSTFKGCSSLTNCSTWELDSDIFAPNIDPQAGFDYVFEGCSSLTTAPIIRASASYPFCNYTYEGCTSLSTIFYLVDTWEAGSMGNFTSDISTLPSTGTLVLADGVSQDGWLGEKVPGTWTIKTWSEYNA